MSVWVNRTFNIDGEDVEVDYETHRLLNALARRFYSVLGYVSDVDEFDFYSSSHPMEQAMYTMALEAYAFNRTYGLE